MNHSFDVGHAQAYGLHEAILIHNLQFWIQKNRANGRHLHDERTWTYNSAKAFADLLPYLSDRQIRRALDNLVELGVLVKGNYNASTYDRTLWYAFAKEDQFLFWQMHSPNLVNALPESGDSLTDSKPVENTDKPVQSPSKAVQKPEHVTQQLWDDFLQVRKTKRAPLTATALTRIEREAQKAGKSLEDALAICCERGWASFQADWVAPKKQGWSRESINAQRTAEFLADDPLTIEMEAPDVPW